MANPPPPYADITGISRTVMKDNAQETIVNYNGNARPGEIVADLTTDPPALYIGNNLGQLTAISSGGPANTGDWTFTDGNATTTVSEPIFVTGFTGEGASLNSDEWAQLYWSANVNGNVDVFNPVNGGDLYAWAYVDSGGFTVQYEDDANAVNHLWRFDTAGNLTIPGNTVIGPGSAGGGSILQNNEPLQVVGEGANAFMVAGWAETTSGPGNVAVIGFNSPLGNGVGNVIIAAGNNATVVNYWNFDNTGNLNAPGDITAIGNVTAGNIGVSERITSQSLVTDPVNLGSLTAVFGARAFILDGNLAAAGNFGAQVSGGGGNSVPVWSDGVNWYIG